MNNLKFVKLRDDAKIPTRELHNAGVDIYPCFDEDRIIIEPHTTLLVPTGIASVIPEGYYIQIQERGSTGSIGIKYGAGVIDSSYRGEWFLVVNNTNEQKLIIDKDYTEVKHSLKEIIYPYNKALFQGILHSTHNEIKSEEITLEEFEKYKNTERGDGKLGSSGK